MKIRTLMLILTGLFTILALASLFFGSANNAIVFALMALIFKPVDQPPGMQAKAVDTEH